MSVSLHAEEELFTSALSFPAVERRRFLERACGDDRELLGHVASLLDRFSEAEECMERPSWLPPALSPRATSVMTRLEEGPGDPIGDYTLVQEIGEGGGGVVYLAEQTTPVRRQVALKIIKLGMDTRALIARFEAERQALAMMDHPNIARVLDAGATPAGRPYFVMELVRGIRITTFCDQLRLSLAERLALFIQTCHAVQHAHQKGIIHRDIKPSNVLVTLHDGAPIAKVIDFGIAKAMAGPLADETMLTELDQFVGTPAYVSPEQTESRGGEVDTRSDIYSLGVLLYELLTGYTPLDTAEFMGVGFDGMRRRIREEEVPTPSQRLRRLDEERITLTAQRRRVQTTRLVQLLHGDLDWIVMRCLEKDRSQRYAAVSDLVGDLQRHLNDEPIVARPRRLHYVFAKFTRRHRVLFAAGTAVLIVLIAATATNAWLAVRAMRAERQAQIEAASRQQVIDFLQRDLLAQASPAEEPDRDLKLRTVLDRAAAKIEGRLPGQPLVEADVRETLARTYDSLGEYAKAREHVQIALEIRQRELGAEHAKTLSLLSYLGSLLTVEGDFTQAEKLTSRAFAAQRRTLGLENAQTLGTMTNLAGIYHQQGRFEAASQLLERALPIQRRLFGADDQQTLVTMNNLALAYRNQGKFADAAALHEVEYASSRRVLGPEHPDTLTSMNNLAVAYSELGRFADAQALNDRALAIAQRVSGPTHPETLILLHNRAAYYLELGQLERAEQLETQTLAELRRVFGSEHPNLLRAQSILAMVYRVSGRLDEARELQQQMLAECRRIIGSKHPMTIAMVSNLALIEEDSRQLARADELLQEAVPAAEQIFGTTHPSTLKFADQRAGVLLKMGDYQAALKILQSSVAQRTRAARDHWRTFSAQSKLGGALLGLGNYDDAERLLLAGHAGLEKHRKMIPAGEAAVLRDSTQRLVDLYRARGDTKQVSVWEQRMRAAGTSARQFNRTSPEI